MRHSKDFFRGAGFHAARAVLIASVAVVLLLPSVAAALDPPDPLNVLFVANGWYDQEDDIEDHLLDLGCDVTVKKDYRVYGSTDLSVYDLIVITEFAPGLSYSALGNIESSEVPVLIVEYWDFWYSYRLGLTSTEYCGYVGTDTITSMQEGYTDFTSRVGAEALVYQPYYTVYGIDLADVESGVTPLYWSSESFGEVAVLVDYERKIAATGVYDTRKYTVDAWKVFDTLLEQIVPEPEGFASIHELAQAYVDSGLYDFIRGVESDLKQQPGSWTLYEAEKEAWLLTSGWHLGELWDYVDKQLHEVFDTIFVPPSFELVSFHPERPHGTGPGYLPSAFPDEHERWFLGQYWDPAGDPSDPPQYGDLYDGTDLGLGMNVKLNGRYFFYMGDTWDEGYLDGDPSNDIQMWSHEGCDPSARCDDMIVVSSDQNPENGIDVSPVFVGGTDYWRPITIPGVHRDPSALLDGYWSSSSWEPTYTVPTGVTTLRVWWMVMNGNGIYVPFTAPMVVLWYGTGIHPGASEEDIDTGDPRSRPTSWVGCSFDGTTFYPCYETLYGEVVPFSADNAPPDNADTGEPSTGTGPPSFYPATGFPARFIQVAAVTVTEADFAKICTGGPEETAMCEMADSGGGFLIFGSGRPYRKSGLFLAFIKGDEFGSLDEYDKPIVHYWTGDDEEPWSPSEHAAVSLTGAPPCDEWRRPDYYDDETQSGGCWPTEDPENPGQYDWLPWQVFGELSARLIRSTEPTVSDQVVVMKNSYSSFVFAWRAPLAEPWEGDFSGMTPVIAKTIGYGPYIIDAYSDSTYPGSGPDGGVELWHTISVWDGTDETPYGVYTGSEVIPWP